MRVPSPKLDFARWSSRFSLLRQCCLQRSAFTGFMAYSVSRRSREFGIRMALGAERNHILASVLRRGLLWSACGVLVGLAGAVALTRLIENLLFGVSAIDPATYLVLSLMLMGVSLTASYIPARRATRMDPVQTLRYE